jgi:hypothetical protein
MSDKKWFKRKLYGYGWTPASGEGWLVLVLYIVFNTKNFLEIYSVSESTKDSLLSFAPLFILSTALLICICIRYGEKPRWQWGKRIED